MHDELAEFHTGNFIDAREIGKGSQSVVLTARRRDDKEIVALKKFSKEIYSKTMYSTYLKREVNIMERVKHENVIKFEKLLETDHSYYIVMPYCKHGDLEQYLNRQPDCRLPEHIALYCLRQIAKGLQAINKKQFIHRDVKPANIFLHEDKVIIGDLGVAAQGDTCQSRNVGTKKYQAPEQRKNPPYDFKIDVYAAGVIFYEMLFGPLQNPPLEDHENFEYGLPKQKSQITSDTESLLYGLLQPEPDFRINWEQCLKHPAFRNSKIPESFNFEQVINSNALPVINEVKDNNMQDEANFVQRWYTHELDKIKFISKVCSMLDGIRWGDSDFAPVSRYMFMIMLLLRRKAKLFYQNISSSLNGSINIFKLDKFNELIERPSKVNELREMLKSLKDKSLDRYDEIREQRKYLTQLQQSDIESIGLIDNESIQKAEIGELQRKYFEMLYNSPDLPSKLRKKDEEKTNYLRIMYYILHCELDETLLPFIKDDNCCFNWSSFTARIKTLTKIELEGTIEHLRTLKFQQENQPMPLSARIPAWSVYVNISGSANGQREFEMNQQRERFSNNQLIDFDSLCL